LWTVFIHTTPYTETTAKVYSQEEDGIYEEQGGLGGWVVGGHQCGRPLTAPAHTSSSQFNWVLFFFCFDFISLMLQADVTGSKAMGLFG
jgi:hypothetical protein